MSERIGYGVPQTVVRKAGGAAVWLCLHGGTPHGIVAVGGHKFRYNFRIISKFRLKTRMNVTECSPFAWKKIVI